MQGQTRPHLGVVLAGGLARRMGGGDKPLVAVGGRPMLDWVLDGLAPQVHRVVINANGDPARFAHYGAAVVADTVEGFAGPLAGILAGMCWARENLPQARFVVSVAADTPFFPGDLVARLTEALAGDDGGIALASSDDGVHPVFGLWPVAMAEDLQRFLQAGESGKILTFVDRQRRTDVRFANIQLPDGRAVDPFFNVNTPEEAVGADLIAAGLGRKRS